MQFYLMKVPPFEDISEILPKQHTGEAVVLVDDVDPETAMVFSEQLEGRGEFLVPEDGLVLETIVLQERTYGDAGVNFSRRLIGNSQQI